ncbi:MAG: hypothetical protein IJ770_00885 [Alphaproteobacteria bacterium]|nr:hypothetical protein [Alphaproteobacteria bacterium]
MKKKTGLLFFAIGVVAGLLGNLAARKVINLKILPENWYEGEDMDDWE